MRVELPFFQIKSTITNELKPMSDNSICHFQELKHKRISSSRESAQHIDSYWHDIWLSIIIATLANAASSRYMLPTKCNTLTGVGHCRSRGSGLRTLTSILWTVVGQGRLLQEYLWHGEKGEWNEMSSWWRYKMAILDQKVTLDHFLIVDCEIFRSRL